jgi:hypothetical protein
VSILSETTIHGVQCDHRGCEAAITGSPISGHFAGKHYYEALAESRGWTIWVARSRQLRCPAHPMRSIGRYTSRVTEAAADSSYSVGCPADCPCRTLPAIPYPEPGR